MALEEIEQGKALYHATRSTFTYNLGEMEVEAHGTWKRELNVEKRYFLICVA